MRVFIDTNILISSALNSGSAPYRAYLKAVSYPNHGVICEQNIDELRRVWNRKFPDKQEALDAFLACALLTLKVVPIPDTEEEAEGKVRDTKDRPILRAALNANVDVLLTGDRDFLESGIEHPAIVTAAQFLEME